MNTYIKTTVAVFVGVLVASALLYGIYALISTVRYDHRNLQQVIEFLNKSIEAQNAQVPK